MRKIYIFCAKILPMYPKLKYFFISLFIILMFLLLIILFASDLKYTMFSSLPIDTLSKIGDSFNVLNSFITLLALFALIYTINIQQKEFSRMNKEARQQSFDSKFFQMLSQIYKISDTIKSNKESNFKILRDKLMNDMVPPSTKENDIISLEDTEIVFDKFYTEYNNSKIFFINLYQLLKYINTNENIDDNNKKHYSKIVRAVLDEEQLVLLFYRGYGVSSKSGSGYMDLIKEFNLFAHLSGPSVICDSKQKPHPQLISLASSISKKYAIDMNINAMLDY